MYVILLSPGSKAFWLLFPFLRMILRFYLSHRIRHRILSIASTFLFMKPRSSSSSAFPPKHCRKRHGKPVFIVLVFILGNPAAVTKKGSSSKFNEL